MKAFPSVLLLLCMCLRPLWADSLRGPVTAVLEPGSERESAQFAAGDLIVIHIGATGPLAAAMKIELGIPDAVRNYRGAYAVYLYRKVSPPPAVERKSYRAEAIEFLLLPPSSRLTLHLPLSPGYMIQESFDVFVIDPVLREADFPLILAVLPVMKGIPSEIADTVFDIGVSFAPSSLGALRLELIFPDDGDFPYVLTVDGVAVPSTADEILLKEGLHTLEIDSPNYLNETLVFSIEAGAYTDLRVEVQARSSRFIAEVPEGTRIFLNGVLIDVPDAAGLEIDPGEHTVVFKIGDYSLSKSFSVFPGTTCILSVDMEIKVKTD